MGSGPYNPTQLFWEYFPPGAMENAKQMKETSRTLIDNEQ